MNRREAEVILDEISRIVDSPSRAKVSGTNKWLSIGVVSLIGSKQAALINRMLMDALGEDVMLRHHIACGDSATFQGNERDIMFLSMVADSASKQAQTAEHFQQRFNVAMSRARDQLYLVGWRFWRCWSSSFTLDPDTCMADLFETLDRLGIEPSPDEAQPHRYTDHRVTVDKESGAREDTPDVSSTAKDERKDKRSGIQTGDRVIIRYLDDNKSLSFVLMRDHNDPVNGFVSVNSPLGAAVFGQNEEDEVDVSIGGRLRQAFIVSAEREGAWQQQPFRALHLRRSRGRFGF